VKTGRIDDKELKVKVFDFDDFMGHEALKEFFEKCLLANRIL